MRCQDRGRHPFDFLQAARDFGQLTLAGGLGMAGLLQNDACRVGHRFFAGANGALGLGQNEAPVGGHPDDPPVVEVLQQATSSWAQRFQGAIHIEGSAPEALNQHLAGVHDDNRRCGFLDLAERPISGPPGFF